MGISKSKAFNEALSLMGINEPIDVLNHLPRKYDDFTYSFPKAIYEDGERVVLLGKNKRKYATLFSFWQKKCFPFYL